MMTILRVVARIASAILVFAFANTLIKPGPVPQVFAQEKPPQQFTVAIRQRKVTNGPNVISVKKGDSVEIVLTADEAAELHLHGYDILLTLTPNEPGKMKFTANIAGRFPLEAHRFGDGTHGGRSRSQQPLIYLEVQPR
jgi:FtsP/CotA-like multicopper oxidase with cupredoxin domain